MDQLLPVINKLQDVFNAVGGERIDLPQICVVGSQSSGKSSVLEHIVGKDFLPRGSGIVTRRPLVLQLYHLPKSKYGEEPKEWGEFLHIPNKRFEDFDKIREEIEAETNRHCGPRGISRVPIRLSVYSPNVLNLTLVDLPGLTKVTIPGQAADLPKQIRSMAVEYISNPNAIILCVSAANTDLSNSDGIQLAKEIDPDGQRTFGVITKIDIMDKGTDALDMLTGKTIPLRLGYVGVVMRSQQDIIDKKSIKQALVDEEKFFASHPVYRPISSRLGTRFCTKSLNTLLMNHIRKTLPELKQRISKMMHDCQTEMTTYGDGFFDNQSKSAMLLNIINNFNSDYTNAIDGKLEESVSELYGGARINIIFTDVYGKYVESIRSGENLSEQDIRTAIKNSAGPRGALIVPEGSFEFLVKSLIKKLEDPSLECAEQVFGELQKIVAKLCESKELKRFQNLRTRILEVVNNLLLNCKIPTRTMISHLIGLELAYINTNHEEFIGGGGAVAKLYETMATAYRVENQASQPYNPSGGPPPQSVNPSGGPPNQPKPPGPQAPGPQNPPSQPQSQQGGGAPGEGGFFGRYFGGNQGGPPGGPQPGGVGGPSSQPGGPGQNPPQGLQPLRPTGQQPPKQDFRKASEPNPFQASPGGPIVLTIPPSIRVGPVTSQEKFETQLIQELIFSYFNIVCKNLKDTVPKSIMHFLVSTSKINMQSELVRYLYKEELFEELLEENPEIAQRRTRCKEMLDALSKANIVLMELRDFDIRS